ncbi:class I SAM-dependent methyltransferase [Desulfonema ishimotonii]|uniref:Class I SAM-dependent methyltransferase n=1 Tax=Desulfonema ishimotonii TaxID=45657 RepID=A0A401G0Q9_9BACT|nr:class I SAM-dependent methyltransferase [Desulfonema ishimotonii]GBC62812.1 class I SAM-dependent methyltransferase [Desulfonema ishimotonii]
MDKTRRTIETYDQCAESFEQKFMDLALYKDSLTCFSERLRPGDAVLDLGCGPGNVSKFLTERVRDLHLLGIDLSEEMVRLARKNVPGAEFRAWDIRKLRLENRSFDAVVAAFCLPFLYDAEAEALIHRVGSLLKPGGQAYLSCMEGDGAGFETTSFSSGKEMFFNYFSEDFLVNAFTAGQLEIRRRIRQDYPEADGSITTDMIFILEKTDTASA